MLTICWYLLKVMACSGILYLYYLLVLRNKLFHHYNRFFLLLAAGLSIILPLVRIHWWQSAADDGRVVKLFSVVADGNAYMDEVAVGAVPNFWSHESLLPVLYILIATLLLAVFIRTLLIIASLLRNNPVEKVGDIHFVNTSHPATPFSFLRYIFWNRHIDAESLHGQQVFKHEVAHVRERHTYDKLFMNLLLILFWYNPFFWLIRKEVHMIHEFIADRKAVEDSDTASFAAMILQTAFPRQQFSVTNNFFYSPIKRRLLMLTKNQNPKASYIGRILVLPLLALLALAFTLKKQNNAFHYEGKKITVVIDAGHGGNDAGADGGTNFREKDITLAIANKIKALNQNADINIILSRDQDIMMAPPERVNFAKAHDADLFISLHCDAENPTGVQRKSGISFIIPGSSNSHFEKSRLIGSALISFLRSVPGITVNETLIERQKGIWILNASSCPAILMEMGYMSAPSDLSCISSAAYQEKLAQAVLQAIGQYAVNTSANNKISKNVMDTVPPVTGAATIQKKTDKPQAPIQQNEILYIINGQEVFAAEAKLVKSENIASVNVLKGEEAIKAYGEKGKNGVIIISTKSSSNTAAVTIPQTNTTSGENDLDDRLFNKVEIAPVFSDNAADWRNFLIKNLDPGVPGREGWKPGTYTVIVQFIVRRDGTLSDIRTENYIGSKTAAHCIELMQKSPRWKPAMQNGRIVTAYAKQPISFVVE